MMHLKRALFLIILANPAWAECGGDDPTFLSCQIENSPNTLLVCHDDETATYRFGVAIERPELELTAPIATLDYTPWPGAGDTIWEEVVFYNQDYTYTVFAAIKRTIPDDRDAMIDVVHFGGVVVGRGGEEIARLSCDPASIHVNFMSSLSRAKHRLGYSWNIVDQGWVALPD